MREVRFDRLVPKQVVTRRKACNLAYLPVGTLEWHGSHLPFGTDSLLVTYVAEEAARRFGGVAFPPVMYGDIRYMVHDSRVEWRQTYRRSMEVPGEFASAFPLQNRDGSPGGECPALPDDGPPAREPLEFTLDGQVRQFARHIAGVMLQIHLYGFRNIILLNGHGGSNRAFEIVEEIYRENVQRRSAFGEPARTLAWPYFYASGDLERIREKHWIHADKWETSLLMSVAPDTMHPELLPEDPKTVPPAYLGHPFLAEAEGYNPERKDDWESYDEFDPRNAGEDYGKFQLEEILGKCGEGVRDFMKGDSK